MDDLSIRSLSHLLRRSYRYDTHTTTQRNTNIKPQVSIGSECWAELLKGSRCIAIMK